MRYDKKTFFILFTICVLAFEVAQVFGSTIELIPVADGSRVYRRNVSVLVLLAILLWIACLKYIFQMTSPFIVITG